MRLAKIQIHKIKSILKQKQLSAAFCISKHSNEWILHALFMGGAVCERMGSWYTEIILSQDLVINKFAFRCANFMIEKQKNRLIQEANADKS